MGGGTSAGVGERWLLAKRRARGRARVAEAAVLLCAAAAAQRWVPMTRWSPLLGEPGGVPNAMQGTAEDGIPARAATTAEARVGSAIARANQRLPFETSCLAQAAAGQVMLRWRHEPGVVVIGLRPPDPDESAWSAHAWLLGRDGALTGGPAAAGFTATTVFGTGA